MPKMYINVNQIKKNLTLVQKHVGESVTVMPVAKANAYGGGIETCGEAFSDCKIIGVANVCEAVRMQKVCPNSKIFVMYQPTVDDIPTIIENDFQISVNEIDFLKELNSKTNKQVAVQIYVDTGHSVLGVQINNLEKFCAETKRLKNIKVVGVFSHFAFDENTTAAAVQCSNSQVVNYKKAIKIAENKFGQFEYKHICNSSGIEIKDSFFNMVRTGRLVYGYANGITMKKQIAVKPSMKYTTNIISIKRFKKGETLGYNKAHVFTRDSVVACLLLGYSNSFPRAIVGKGSVVVNGQKAPVLHVTMNLSCVDITDVTGQINLGDEVAVFDNEVITLEELAEWCGVPNYIMLTQLGRGVEHCGQT